MEYDKLLAKIDEKLREYGVSISFGLSPGFNLPGIKINNLPGAKGTLSQTELMYKLLEMPEWQKLLGNFATIPSPPNIVPMGFTGVTIHSKPGAMSWHPTPPKPKKKPSDADLLLDLGETLHQTKVECQKEGMILSMPGEMHGFQLARISLALKFEKLSAEKRFRAIMKDWSYERIVQEIY